MKTTFEEKLAVAATNTKLNARKALKHPITSILSLCVFAGIAATVALYAHTNYYGLDDLKYVGTAGPAISPATLPAERTLIDTQGRPLAGKVLSKTDKAIQFVRASDQQEFAITLDKLSAADRSWLNGTPASKPTPELRKSTAKIRVSVTKPGHPDWEIINVGDDIHVIRENDKWLTLDYLGYEILVKKGLAEVTATPAGDTPAFYMDDDILAIELLQRRDPVVASNWASIYKNESENNQRRYLIPLLESITPKPPGTAETVSLRPEFEKLGVKPLRQVGNTCAIYTARHIMDFYTKKGLAPVIDFDKIKNTIDKEDAARDLEDPQGTAERIARHAKLGISDNMYSYSQVIRRAIKSVPKMVNNEWEYLPASIEFIKQEIRNGRPVSVGGQTVRDGQTRGHQQLVVGFKTPDQELKSTQLEVLDSNAAGYIWINATTACAPESINFQ
jgi:hypothetical protein